MLEDYQNKVCVVTGAASGIGKALCEKLVALGAQVYALDRNKADIEGLSAFVETDLSDKGSIDAAFCVLPQVIDRILRCGGSVRGADKLLADVHSEFYSKQVYDRYIFGKTHSVRRQHCLCDKLWWSDVGKMAQRVCESYGLQDVG